jgi:HD-like signal output (HDOD) protein
MLKADSKMSNLFKGFEDIPATFSVLLKLTHQLREPKTDLEDVAELIAVDPGLSVAVVKLSNCAYFGCAEPSRTIEEAVRRIGFSEVMKLVSIVSQRRFVTSPLSAYGDDGDHFWKDSLATAIMMEFLAYDAGVDPGLAYTIGLLSGLGKYPIAALLSRVKPYARAPQGQTFLQLARWEKQECQHDHAQAGAELLAQWGFHPSIHLPIAAHLRPLLVSRERQTSSLLHLARSLSPFVQDPTAHDSAAGAFNGSLLSAAGVTSEIIEGYLFPANAWLRTTESQVEQELLCA